MSTPTRCGDVRRLVGARVCTPTVAAEKGAGDRREARGNAHWRTGCRSGQIAGKPTVQSETGVLSLVPERLAGAPGFEPGDGGIKIRCLTAWLRPISTDGDRESAASRVGITARRRAGNRWAGASVTAARRRGDRKPPPCPRPCRRRRTARRRCRGWCRNRGRAWRRRRLPAACGARSRRCRW